MLLVAVALVTLLRLTKSQPEVEPLAETRFNVQTQTIRLGTLAPELALIAEVSSAARPMITAAVAGEVTAMPARAGLRVDKGELLLELDDRDAQVLLSQAQAELAQAEAALELDRQQAAADRENLEQEQVLARLSETELARLVRLRERGLVSQTQLDQAKQNHQRAQLQLVARQQAVDGAQARRRQLMARLLAAEAGLQSAELQLERTQVRAPFAAVITATHVELGGRVSPGQQLLELYDATRIELRTEVPTRQLGELRHSLDTGRRVGASIEFAGQSHELELIRLGQDARGGTVEAWLRLLEPAPLPLGMRLPLGLQLPAVEGAVSLPESGLYDLSKVFRVRDGRLESLNATIHGSRAVDGRLQVVLSHPALQDGDQLLVTHLANAVSGLPVLAQAR